MVEKHVIVKAEDGLHARPANDLAQAAGQLSILVSIRTATGEPQQADSVLGLMMLGAAHGDTLVLSATGEGAEEALSTLAEIIESSR